MNLTLEQQHIHSEALNIGKSHRRVESETVEILMRVDETKLYKKLNKRSLFAYAVDLMGLDESVAYACITVARKCKDTPRLYKTVMEQKLTVSKANRIVAAITPDNADELIQYACTHTTKYIDMEVAKRNPKAARKERVKFISAEYVEVTTTLHISEYEKSKRVESLLAQKNKEANFRNAAAESFEAYLNANDPVRKAERATKKTKKPRKITLFKQSNKRKPRTAAENHEVNLRDQGRCTHIDLQGNRCNSDRWTETHHIIQVSEGGTNDPENLTTLCSFHHDMVHQMTMPLEGQFSWLR